MFEDSISEIEVPECHTDLTVKVANLRWNIKNISLYFQSQDDYLETVFRLAPVINCEYSLKLSAKAAFTDPDLFMSLYISTRKMPPFKTQSNAKSNKMCFFIIDKNGAKKPLVGSDSNGLSSNENILMFKLGNDVQINNFMKIKELFDPKAEFLQNDTLSIVCSITYILEETETKNPDYVNPSALKSLEQMSGYFGHLLEHNCIGDIVLKAGDIKFYAQKSVLAARSSKFAAMFKNQTKESQKSHFDVCGVEPEIFRALLNYIYTDKVNDVDMEQLLKAADMYGVENLKKICEAAVIPKLTVANATDYLLLSTNHNAEQLKCKALEFINSRMI